MKEEIFPDFKYSLKVSHSTEAAKVDESDDKCSEQSSRMLTAVIFLSMEVARVTPRNSDPHEVTSTVIPTKNKEVEWD